MPNLSIRQLTKEELKKAVSIIDAAFSGYFTDEADKTFQNEDRLELYGAFLDKKMVGTVGVCPAGFMMHAFGIYWISVLPECQKQGIGSRLIEHAIDVIKTKSPSKPTSIFLLADHTNYYARFGFEITNFQTFDGSSLMAMVV